MSFIPGTYYHLQELFILLLVILLFGLGISESRMVGGLCGYSSFLLREIFNILQSGSSTQDHRLMKNET